VLPLFHCRDLDLGPVTLKLNLDLDIVKMYLQTENEKLLGQAIQNIQLELKKYKNSSQGQRSRSEVTNFEPLLAFSVGHISNELHQFLVSSFQDFMRTDPQTDTAKNNTCSRHDLKPVLHISFLSVFFLEAV